MAGASPIYRRASPPQPVRTAVAALLLCLAPGALATAQGVVPASVHQATEYRLQAGDQLEIKFFYNPTLNEQVIVRPDGRISLQLVQEIVVAGLTPAGLTRELTERYAVDLKQPQVTVIVRGFGAQRVFVDGEVNKPGVVPIATATTALQAIAQAGGLKESARATEVIVIRRSESNPPQAFQINLKAARNGTDFTQDITLAPFDVLFVPRSRIGNVNVWLDQYIRKSIPFPFSLQYGLLR